MPQNLTNVKSPLVQVMAWCHQALSHHLSQCLRTYVGIHNSAISLKLHKIWMQKLSFKNQMLKIFMHLSEANHLTFDNTFNFMTLPTVFFIWHKIIPCILREMSRCCCPHTQGQLYWNGHVGIVFMNIFIQTSFQDICSDIQALLK